MKKLSRKLIILISVIATLIIAAVSVSVYAAITKSKARGEVNVDTISLTANTTYSSSKESFNWTFTKAGDSRTVTISTTNSSGVVLHRFYTITCTDDSVPDVAKAILVYYNYPSDGTDAEKNNSYIGTLAEILSDGTEIKSTDVFVSNGATSLDYLKFELHQSAQNGTFDKSTINLSINTYTENADYTDYMFAGTEAELQAAIDDVNTGLTTSPIVLTSDLTLSSSHEITAPVTLYLNNYSLSGSKFILNSSDALLAVEGEGSFSATVDLTSYDTESAKELVLSSMKEKLGGKVASGASGISVLGYYSFYGFTITASAGTYSSGSYTAPTTTTSRVEYFSIGDVKEEFKVVGSLTALTASVLAHMPATTTTVVTTDLFLPTYIPSNNATISWLSDNTSIMNSSGEIVAKYADKVSVNLYATIKVNDTVSTEKFTFLVSAHNNQINFLKLVQEISPLIIYNVYTGDNDGDAKYYLPVVDSNSDYDYRKDYTTPANEDPTSATANYYRWNKYKDIDLSSLTYGMTEDQAESYTYIGIDENSSAVYLKNNTINTYAKIMVYGQFDDDERTYESVVNVSIAIGSDTQLLEKAFSQINDDINQIDVLENILKTRLASGIASEKGDFMLRKKFEDYTFTYSVSSDAVSVSSETTAVDGVDYYTFTVNPEEFSKIETGVAITVTAQYKSTDVKNTKVYYVTLPAALHSSDFGTASIFSSVKYQVLYQLPSAERTSNTGFEVGSTISNATADYLLLRDIVGDADYESQYGHTNDYVSNLASAGLTAYTGTTDLYFYTSSASNVSTASTDYKADVLARLIAWATGTTKVAASTVYSTYGTNYTSTLAANKSNGEAYLTPKEVAVIKAYYMDSTGISSDDFETLWGEVAEEKPGYIYQNPDLINKVIALLGTNLTDSSSNWSCQYGNYSFGGAYMKYLEIIDRYACTTSENEEDKAPSAEIYNKTYVWTAYATSASGTSISVHGGKYWNRSSGSPTYSTNSTYYSDKTEYITQNELFILKVFWLNCIQNKITSTFSSTDQNAIQAIIDANPEDYEGYVASTDFTGYGQSIINGFDACLVIPTYFTTEGIESLISDFYTRCKTTYKFRSYLNASDTTTYVSNAVTTSINNELSTIKTPVLTTVPTVTNLDNLSVALSYFTKLTNLYIYGNSKQPAFLSDNGLSKSFTNMSLKNANVETLAMEYVSSYNFTFDVTNLKNFSKLKYIDLSNNLGIHSTNELVNVHKADYRYLDIYNVDVTYEFMEFAIDNISKNNCYVYFKFGATDHAAYPTTTFTYNSANGDRQYQNTAKASLLSDLTDFDKFVSENMYMTNVVYDGTNGTNVWWRVEEGNTVDSASYGAIAADLSTPVFNYYYASSTFSYDGFDFESGHVYRVTGDSNLNIVFTDLGISNVQKVSSISNTTEFTSDEIASATSESASTETVTLATTYTLVKTSRTAPSTDSTTGRKTIGSTSQSQSSFGPPSTTVNNVSVNYNYYVLSGNSYLTDNSSGTISEAYYLIYDSSSYSYWTLTETSVVRHYSYSAATLAYKNMTYYLTNTITLNVNNSDISIPLDTCITVYYTYENSSGDTTYYDVTTTETTKIPSLYYSTGTARGGGRGGGTTVNADGYTEITDCIYQYNTSSSSSYVNIKGTTSSSTSTGATQTISSGIRTYISDVYFVSPTLELNSASDVKNVIDISMLAKGTSCVYRYVGTTTTYSFSNSSGNGIGSAITFTKNSYYSVTFGTSGFIWNSTVNPSSGTSMDGILNTANQNFSNSNYGNYYGMYYGYMGDTITSTSTGITYKNSYLYRIMPNSTNTAFTWVEVCQYNKSTGSATAASAQDVLRAVASGNASENDVFYITTNISGFFGKGWYKVVRNQQTKSLNLVYFTDVTETISTNYTTLTNNKIVTLSAGDYLGYSGTYTIVVSAIYRINSVEYVKKYKIKFVGTIIANNTSTT